MQHRPTLPPQLDLRRRIGALVGLVAGWAVMYATAPVNLITAFIFGVTGCLIGGSIGKRMGAPKDRSGASRGRTGVTDGSEVTEVTGGDKV